MTEQAVVEPEEAVAAAAAAASSTSSSTTTAHAAPTAATAAAVASCHDPAFPDEGEGPAPAPAPAPAIDTSVGGGESTSGLDTSTSLGEAPGGGGGWKVGPEDFALLCVIGQGAFGRVLQVRSKLDQEVYAMKVISKRMLKKKNHLSYMRYAAPACLFVHPPIITPSSHLLTQPNQPTGPSATS
jgi:p70 ribosomal S6 kinase